MATRRRRYRPTPEEARKYGPRGGRQFIVVGNEASPKAIAARTPAARAVRVVVAPVRAVSNGTKRTAGNITKSIRKSAGHKSRRPLLGLSILTLGYFMASNHFAVQKGEQPSHPSKTKSPAKTAAKAKK